MSASRSRLILWGIIAAVVAAALVYAFLPKPVLVAMEQVQRNNLRVTVQEEAKSRVHDVYVLSAPVTGYLRRIEVEVGDQVQLSQTIVAEIEPIDPTFLDTRSEAQAKAAVQAMLAAEKLAQAEVSQAEAELEFALAEFKRMRELRKNNSASERELDNAQRLYKSRRASLATAQAALQMREFEHERAKAQLLSPADENNNHEHCACLTITTPVSGKVLKVINKSEGVVQAGTPLLEIGDPADLEIVVELLSFDAVAVQPGNAVVIKNWGGVGELLGTVQRIEPIGFTKVSALGIEEQRVNVIVDLESEYSDWQRLGHAYQMDVEIILWQGQDILTIPLTALFRDQENWAVYAVEDGVAVKRVVELGKKNHELAQVLAGIEEGEWLIPHPNDQIANGVLVEPIHIQRL